jgi:hypothetical protein
MRPVFSWQEASAGRAGIWRQELLRHGRCRSKDKWNDDRDIDDQIFVTLEFPGKTYDKNKNDIAVVTYSSISTNRQEFYGETVFGSRGTLIMKEEKEALLYKEQSPSSGGGLDQRLWVIDNAKGGGPALDSYNTAAPTAAGAMAQAGMGDKVSRGYKEEMEHFCYCVSNKLGADNAAMQWSRVPWPMPSWR